MFFSACRSRNGSSSGAIRLCLSERDHLSQSLEGFLARDGGCDVMNEDNKKKFRVRAVYWQGPGIEIHIIILRLSKVSVLHSFSKPHT